MMTTASSADMPTWVWAQDDLWAQGPPHCRTYQSHDWLSELLRRGTAIPCASETFGVGLQNDVALHAIPEAHKEMGLSSTSSSPA